MEVRHDRIRMDWRRTKKVNDGGDLSGSLDILFCCVGITPTEERDT